MDRLPVILAVEHVRSLHNIGSLFRTADAANIALILLSEYCATPPRHEIEKTALGATRTVAWEQTANFSERLSELKQSGYLVCALEQSPAATDLFITALSLPLVLVVGHERSGVTSESLALCDHHVYLPMRGKSAHSLNVSNAAAIALYELGRRVWYD